jgi:hypothetical protein
MIRNRRTSGTSFIRRVQSLAVRPVAVTAFFAAIAACLCISTSVQAQTGKITAKIVDAQTGQPMIHATVLIVETRQGAYTNDQGVATIINVAPSENYTIVAKYPEYIADTVRRVKVQSDITTPLSLKLGVKGGNVIVVAQAPLVEKTKTDISTKFAASTLESMPGRQRLDQVILLTPGVVQDNSNGGVSIHGSRGTSNKYTLDGVDITDPISGKASTLQTSMSRLAVSEVNVVTAGGDASKGGYTGGVISTSTQSGGNQLALTAHYRNEIPSLFGSSSNGFKQMPEGDHIYELAVGGPLLTQDVKFFLTGKLNTFQFYNTFSDPTFSNQGLGVTDPLGNNAGQLPNTQRFYRSGTGKVTFDAFGFSTSVDAALSSETDMENSVGGVNSTGGGISGGALYLDPYYLPINNIINNSYSLSARGELVPGGVLEFTGSYTLLDRQFGRYDQSQPVDAFHLPHFLSLADNYTYNDQDGSILPKPDGIIDIYTPATRQTPNPSNPTQPNNSVPGLNPFTGRIEGPSINVSTANAYGLQNIFPVAGNVGGFLIQNTDDWSIDTKYTTQIGSHLINGGIQGSLFTAYRYEDQLPWDANPFKDSFQVHPYTAAAYISDKMEFSDITFNPGLRFDMYQPNSAQIVNVFNPIGDSLTATKLQTQLSPRLGITYAVTDQTTFNFNYNWYFKQPALDNVLTGTAVGNFQSFVSQFSRGNQIIGNGGLLAERSKEVAVGFQTQLSDVFAFSVQGVYKDLRNQAGLQIITSPDLPVGYTFYTDDQYGSAKSIELTMEKRMSDNYSVKFDYTYSSSLGTSSSATEAYQKLINADPGSEQAVLPLSPFPFSYDKPHVAELLFNINYNQGEGPTIFGSKLLQMFSLSTSTEYSSGTPYTALDLKGNQVGPTNGDREPDYFQTDATLTRTIALSDLFGPSFSTAFLDLQLEVTNVFNRTDALFVFPATGQGDNDGASGQYLAVQEYYNDPTDIHGGQLDQFGRLLYNPRIDLNHDGRVSLAEQQVAYTRLRTDYLARRTGYQIPRKVYFNVFFRF